MKKLVLIAVLFFSVLGVVAIAAIRRQPARIPLPQPTPAPELARLVPPVFPSPVVLNQPTYVVPTIAVTFPAHLPEFAVSAIITKEVVGKIAQSLGFSGAPQELSGAQGVTYVWSAGAASLVAAGNPLNISYTSGKTPSGVASSSPLSLDSAARQTLGRLNLPALPYELVKLPLRYFTTSGFDLVEVDTPLGATVVEAGYQYSLTSRPVYGTRPNEPGVAVRFNAKGEVVSLAATLLPAVKDSGRSVAIASSQVLAARFIRGEAVLLYLFADLDKNNFTAPQYAVSSVSVRSVSLGYYYSPLSTSLSPVFLAEGVGQDNETGSEVRFMSLISALP